MSDYKKEMIHDLALMIIKAGYRVWLSKNGDHGFFTNHAEDCVVSFETDISSLRFSGNYRAVNANNSKAVGCGWVANDEPVWPQDVTEGAIHNMLKGGVPAWATRGGPVELTTLAQHLDKYQEICGYTELLPTEVSTTKNK